MTPPKSTQLELWIRSLRASNMKLLSRKAYRQEKPAPYMLIKGSPTDFDITTMTSFKLFGKNQENALFFEHSSVDSMGKRHVPQPENATRTVAFWHSLEMREEFLPCFHWNFNLREDKNISKTDAKNTREEDK